MRGKDEERRGVVEGGKERDIEKIKREQGVKGGRREGRE